MTPNFALNLSEDGITLLHRAAHGDGWVEVGQVPLDADDLGAALAELRDTAVALEGSDFATKLILPPSQLLYATITVDEDLSADVVAALEARTPYSVDQLSYDISGAPPEVQVVAVARETLAEAESFIAPHGFNPVGFTAVPEEGHFSGEPNLGAMPATGADFDPDPEPVKVIPAVEAAAATREVDTTAEEEQEPEVLAEPAADDVPETESGADESAEGETALEAELTSEEVTDAQSAAETEIEIEIEIETGAEVVPDPKEESDPDSDEDADSKAEEAPEPELASEPEPKLEPEVATEPDPEPHLETEPEPANDPAPIPAVAAPKGTPPAAFSSRRRPTLGPATEDAPGVKSRAPRIGIGLDAAPKAAKAKKPPRVEPRIKTGEAAKSKPAPPIIPPATPASVTEPKKKRPSRMGAGISALKSRKTAKTPPAAAPAISGKPDPIAELAARQAAGKPRFLGLILTAILLVCLMLFAAFSSYLLPDEIARLLGREAPETVAAVEDTTTPEAGPSEGLLDTAEPEIPIFTIPSPEEIAEAEIPEPEIVAPERMTETEAETVFAVSGIWQLPPEQRQPVVEQTLDTLYESSLDPDLAFEDAPALARFDPNADAAPELPNAPPPAAILFTLDERGLVRPSPEGALNPDGILVFTGPPPVAAVQRPRGLVPESDTGPEEAQVAPEADAPAGPEAEIATEDGASDAPFAVDPALAEFRPRVRPADLQVRFERANQGGRSTAELARIRPQERPQSAIEKARDEAIARALAEAEASALEAEAIAAAEAAAQAELDKPTAQAVARSLRPGSRPRNFERVVARARTASPETRNAAAAASTASAARATGPAVARASRAAPTGNTRASVARAATDNNAISLGRVALIGVFGTSSNRRALVRMPSGRFKKVAVGDRVDGGKVAAIGEGQLKYTKGGRTVTLQMPKG